MMSNLKKPTFRAKFDESDRDKYEKAVCKLSMDGNTDWFLLADPEGKAFVNYAVHCHNPDADMGELNEALERVM